MISIIIASAKAQMLADVSVNIGRTIGIPFEILGFDNGNAEKGICEIYNTGASKAKYEILCFMHEDIEIKTFNWGKIVIDAFLKNKDLGLLGVAGSKYKTLAPSGVFCHDTVSRLNILQGFKYGRPDSRINFNNPDNEVITDVVAVDGVWFCAPRTVVLKHSFDEGLFKGFHCYDIDFSLNVGRAFKVAITYEVLLAHFSEGNYGQSWVEQTLLMQQKWQEMLPIAANPLSHNVVVVCEKNAFRFFLETMKSSGFSIRQRLNVLWNSKIYSKFGWHLFLKLQFYILRNKI